MSIEKSGADFKNKVVVVTGSSRGIGKGIAEEFARNQATVVITGITLENAEKTSDELGKKYPHAKFIPGQLRVEDRKSVQSLVNKIIKDFKKIDVWVNNAGYLEQKPFESITDSEWDNIMNINLKGVFICCQEVLPHMVKAGHGKIINTSSIGGQIGGPKAPHYSAAKAGVICLTKSLARIYSPKGINVNCVAPDLVNTDMTKKILEQLSEDDIKNKIPIGRVAQPADIAKVVLFLASEEAGYITGQVININGGSFMY